ncbi:MAG: uridine kinase [Bdellovibrionia bacterium]
METRTWVIAIVGGSGSGKTTLAKKLQQEFGEKDCVILSQDSYYIDQSHKFDRDGGAVNFDHPSSLEFTLLAKHLERLKAGSDIEVPIYDFPTHKRLTTTETLRHHPLVLVDGTLVLSQRELLPYFDESIFLDVDEDTRFQRRMKRDIEERGRTPEGVREQFYKQVKVMHDEFVEPSKTVSSILLSQSDVVVQKQTNSKLHSRIVELLKSMKSIAIFNF